MRGGFILCYTTKISRVLVLVRSIFGIIEKIQKTNTMKKGAFIPKQPFRFFGYWNNKKRKLSRIEHYFDLVIPLLETKDELSPGVINFTGHFKDHLGISAIFGKVIVAENKTYFTKLYSEDGKTALYEINHAFFNESYYPISLSKNTKLSWKRIDKDRVGVLTLEHSPVND